MELLQCTIRVRRPRQDQGRAHEWSLKVNYANPLTEIGRATAESTARAAKSSMDSAERTLHVQIEYAKGALKQATLNARAAAQVKDVQELLTLRSRIAENAIENMIG